MNTWIYDSKLPHFYHTNIIGFDELKNYVDNHSDALPLIDVLIHYEFPFTPAAIWQRNGRIDRKELEHNPHIYYFKTV